MPYTQDIVDEINILVRYNLNTTQEGIKVHKTAAPEIIAATKRLYDKGLGNTGGWRLFDQPGS